MAADGLRLGVVLQPVDPPDEFVRTVHLVEELGYDALWLTDSSLHARYVFSYLTLAAVNSSRILLGSGVTNPVTRHPALLAVAAATVDEIAGGRFVLGIGAGDRPLTALRARPASLRRLESAIVGLRQLLAGERVSAQ